MSIRAIKWAHSVLPLIDLPPTDKLALLILCFHHHDKTGDCFPSMQTIADSANVSSRRIQKSITALVDWNLIKKKRGGTAAGNASNRYTLFGKPKRPKQTGKRVPVSGQSKPEQKSRFQTGTPFPVSNRNTCSDDRGYYSDEEKGPANLRVVNGGRFDV